MRLGKLLLWSPRILGVLVCLFLSLFALDAFGGGKTFIQSLPDFGIHVAFTGLAAAYACSPHRNLYES